MASQRGRDGDEPSVGLSRGDGTGEASGREEAGVEDQQVAGPRALSSGPGYLDSLYHHAGESPSHSYHADLYDDELEHLDLGVGPHSRSQSDVMTIEETYLNEDARVADLKDVEGAGGGVESAGGLGGTHREDPVSRWVEKTFTGEAPAVRTQRGGSEASGGVILMGVPPVVAPLSKKAQARKSTKMKMLSAQKKWLCVDDTGSADLVRFRRGVVETRCAMRDTRWEWTRCAAPGRLICDVLDRSACSLIDLRLLVFAGDAHKVGSDANAGDTAA